MHISARRLCRAPQCTPGSQHDAPAVTNQGQVKGPQEVLGPGRYTG